MRQPGVFYFLYLAGFVPVMTQVWPQRKWWVWWRLLWRMSRILTGLLWFGPGPKKSSCREKPWKSFIMPPIFSSWLSSSGQSYLTVSWWSWVVKWMILLWKQKPLRTWSVPMLTTIQICKMAHHKWYNLRSSIYIICYRRPKYGFSAKHFFSSCYFISARSTSVTTLSTYIPQPFSPNIFFFTL